MTDVNNIIPASKLWAKPVFGLFSRSENRKHGWQTCNFYYFEQNTLEFFRTFLSVYLHVSTKSFFLNTLLVDRSGCGRIGELLDADAQAGCSAAPPVRLLHLQEDARVGTLPQVQHI